MKSKPVAAPASGQLLCRPLAAPTNLNYEAPFRLVAGGEPARTKTSGVCEHEPGVGASLASRPRSLHALCPCDPTSFTSRTPTPRQRLGLTRRWRQLRYARAILSLGPDGSAAWTSTSSPIPMVRLEPFASRPSPCAPTRSISVRAVVPGGLDCSNERG